MFDDSFSITQIGETGYVNENPVALCSAEDVKGPGWAKALKGLVEREIAKEDAR